MIWYTNSVQNKTLLLKHFFLHSSSSKTKTHHDRISYRIIQPTEIPKTQVYLLQTTSIRTTTKIETIEMMQTTMLEAPNSKELPELSSPICSPLILPLLPENLIPFPEYIDPLNMGYY